MFAPIKQDFFILEHKNDFFQFVKMPKNKAVSRYLKKKSKKNAFFDKKVLQNSKNRCIVNADIMTKNALKGV